MLVKILAYSFLTSPVLSSVRHSVIENYGIVFFCSFINIFFFEMKSSCASKRFFFLCFVFSFRRIKPVKRLSVQPVLLDKSSSDIDWSGIFNTKQFCNQTRFFSFFLLLQIEWTMSRLMGFCLMAMIAVVCLSFFVSQTEAIPLEVRLVFFFQKNCVSNRKKIFW